ncbi:MAG: aldehyde dehydrogenase family protein [Chloroflexi bacterium]|nr:aldehyde dehydrogenase family protein [Chloroflexota bacterium]
MGEDDDFEHQGAFAPVASVNPYYDFGEALEQAEASDYGLQASVFTRDIQRFNFEG